MVQFVLNKATLMLVIGVFVGVFGVQSPRVALAGVSGTQPTTQTPVVAVTQIVNIQNFQFSPQQVIITPGTKVTWVNQDSSPHTTTSDNVGAQETWDSGTLQQGQSFSKTFTRPGTYTYHCNTHPSMPHGTVQVLEPGQSVTTPVTQLPSTGAPVGALAALGGIIPIGFRLLKFDRKGDIKPFADNLWQERQFKKSLSY